MGASDIILIEKEYGLIPLDFYMPYRGHLSDHVEHW